MSLTIRHFRRMFAASAIAALIAADAAVGCPHTGRRRRRLPPAPQPMAPPPATPSASRLPQPAAAAGDTASAGQSGAAEEHDRQGDRQGQAGREIGRRYFQPRAVPAAEGRRKSMGSLPHVAAQARRRPAGRDRRLRLVVDPGLRLDRRRNSPIRTGWRRNCSRQYPAADITVVNRGVGGEDAPEMMKRLQTAVIDANPDLVIWQVGTNAVLRDLDPADTAKHGR